MNRNKRIPALASAPALTLALSLAAAAPAQAGDAEAGKTVFIKCGVCHTLEKDVSKVGPSLYGVFGRKAGTLASFALYTDAMKNSGVVWDDDTIRQLVKQPRTFIQGTRMVFIGLKDDKQIDDLLAYLKTAQPPAE